MSYPTSLSSFVARRPPRSFSTGSGAPFSVAFAPGVGTTGIALQNIPTGGTGTWFTFVATVDCHIRFGSFSGDTATVSDFLMRAGVQEEWYVMTADTFVRVIGDTLSGTLRLWRSSR